MARLETGFPVWLTCQICGGVNADYASRCSYLDKCPSGCHVPCHEYQRMCTFRTCRFCGVHRGQLHLSKCNWTDVHNPIPDVLFGTDEDWDNREEYQDA